MEAGELIKRAVDFLSTYYKGEISVAANKDKGYIHIDFRLVIKHDIGMADIILDDFEMSIQAFRIAAGDIASTTAPTNFNIRFTNIPSTQCKEIWKLRAKEINQFVVVTGYIRRVSDVQHKINSAVFECRSCNESLILFMPPQESKIVYPTYCGACKSKTKFILKDKHRIDEQKIVVEEDPSQIKSTQKPRSIIVILREDLCRHEIDQTLQPSTKVVVSGLLKEKPVRKDANDFRKYILANSVELRDDNIENLKITDKDIKELTEMSQSTTLFNDLAQSIVPNVYGHDVVKLAVLFQLVGGVPLYKEKHLEERGVIHILLIGNPGQGKSVFLKRAWQFLPGSRFTGGKGASGVGLVAAVQKDEELGGWTLNAGAVAMCSGAMCCIDEVDKISKEDISHLNNAMVDMKVSIDKATVHGTLATETIILAAANPVGRVFDKRDTLWKQFGLPKDFLDRFDLIFPIESSTDKDHQKNVADLIVGKYVEGNKFGEPIYPLNKVMKYIAFARGKFNPKLNQPVQRYLVDNFITLVKPVDPDEDAPTFSYRLLTNIIRLTLAVCKARLSERVTIGDAKLAISILTESLKMQEIITPDGFDYERAEEIMPKKRRDKVRVIKEIIRACQKESEDQLAEYGEVAKSLKPFNIGEQEFDELLEKMTYCGEVIEPKRGRYKILE